MPTEHLNDARAAMASADLPFVEMGDPGISLQIVHADVDAGMWVMNTRVAPTVRTPTHLHTGAVHGFTTKGQWRYEEYPELYGPGSYIYEPAGSVHTYQALPGEVVEASFVVFGEIHDLDSDGNVTRVLDATLFAKAYSAACKAAGHEKPQFIGVR